MDCKTHQIYDPVRNKCVSKKSKRGYQLLHLIDICRDFEKADPECKDINRVYRTKYIKFKKAIKKTIVPLVSIITFNIMIFAALTTSKRIRKKLLRFSLDNVPAIAPYTFIIEPLVLALPTIMTFVTKYLNLARVAVLGLTPSTIIGTIDTILRLYSELPEVPRIRRAEMAADELAVRLEPMPGSWKGPLYTPAEIAKRVSDLEKPIESALERSSIITLNDYINLFYDFVPVDVEAGINVALNSVISVFK